MSRTLSLSVVAIFLASFMGACATSPIVRHGQTVRPPDDLYTCALNTLTAMGYEVSDVDRQSGFIRARKKTTGGVLQLHGWSGLLQRDHSGHH